MQIKGIISLVARPVSGRCTAECRHHGRNTTS